MRGILTGLAHAHAIPFLSTVAHALVMLVSMELPT